MQQKVGTNRTASRHLAGGCGQNTTELVTAAERHCGPGAGSRRRALLALGPWLLVCWGCGTFVTATPINPAPRPMVPRAPESVQVLASGAPLEPHVDVALLEVEQSEGFNRQGTDYMIQRLREKAAELGCDAVYVKSRSAHEGGNAWLDPDSTLLLASCVVFTPPGAEPPPLQTAGTPVIQLMPVER